jgi:hypothetical protein
MLPAPPALLVAFLEIAPPLVCALVGCCAVKPWGLVRCWNSIVPGLMIL